MPITQFRPPKSLSLAAIFTFIFCIRVFALVNAQQINLSFKDVPLETVFKEIKKQSGYGFMYEKEEIASASKVSIELKNGTLKQALDISLKNQPYIYEIFDKTVVVKRRAKKNDQPNQSNNSIIIKGKVTDEQGTPMLGVIIRLKSTEKFSLSDKNGEFSIEVPDKNSVLTFSYLGFEPQEVAIEDKLNLNIILKTATTQLDIITVNTGFDNIQKERATGSFTQINNELLNRSVSTNILDRLDGVASGLIFTISSALTRNRSMIEIRGRSTIFSNAEPLIVIDNFPYEGDLANINPNDVEDITILKDAAASSVWGARAGNGVIVITTKKGRLNKLTDVSINSNVTIGEKPDLYYKPQLSSAQYIEVEQYLFDKGAFNSLISNGYSALSPAVETLLAHRSGEITESEKTARLNELAGYDVRQQILKYYYRQSLNQQYQLNIKGGSNNQSYYLSGGFDSNMPNAVSSSYNRLTLNASNTYYLLKNKLEFTSGIIYTVSNNKTGQTEGDLNYPYSQVADSEGNALIVPLTLRPSYISNASNGKLLNWFYKPLEELNNDYNAYRTNLTDYRINLSLKYKITNELNAVGYFSYEKGFSDSNRLNELESYYTRNQINQFTQINSSTGAITYPLPMGSILNSNSSTIQSANGRFQINYNKKWKKHEVNALGGTEIRDFNRMDSSNTFYGYNDDTKTNQNVAVNTTVNFPYFYGTGTSRIIINPSQQGNTNRYISYYLTGSYTFNDTYIASLSARKDESNIFGVSSNQRGVPLWSAGLAWIINKEDFYNLNWLPQLKLRTSFGYTGNVNNSISAYLTAVAGGSQIYNAYNARIDNPPNPSLRWEKNRNINIGVDFAFKNNRINGSIDWWHKKGLDLIGNSPIAPQTGIAVYTGNSANTITKGVDIELNSTNLNGIIKWYTTLLYNHSESKVTNYKVSNGTNLNVVSANYNNPLEGYPYFAVFSFKYGGLNNLGNPQGYLNGNISTDYTAIRNSINRDDLVYNGSAVPTDFGSLRNSFIYKGFDFSFNILYKLGYYFRRNSLNNGSIYTTSANPQQSDYELRWQNPGDELNTNVPALIYPNNTARTSIYTYADVLVEKADHIRLRDIRLGYTLPKLKNVPFRSLNLFTYINNLGILWRANKHKIDPDFATGIPLPRTFAFGLRANL